MRVRRLLTSLFLALVSGLAMAAPALAGDNGEGWYGTTDDKVITYTAFMLIAGIPLLIVILNAIQRAMVKRKEERGG